MFACNDKDEDDDTDDNEVKDRTTTITGLLDNNSSATVRGVFTKAELESVANTLKTTINALFNEDKTEWGEEDAAFYRGAFARGMIYIVERNPDGYTNVKTTGDGKTVYIALDKIDTGYVRDGMGKAYKNETYIS
jgi:hypothetical protein